MWDKLKRHLAGTLAVVTLLTLLYITFVFGRITMHTDLTSDMKREQEAGLPCRNPYGLFYLYTYDMSFWSWEANHWRSKK